MTKKPSVKPEMGCGTTPDHRPLRRRVGGRSAHVKDAVFNAALDLLREQGYESVSMGKISALSGVHETSLYRRWATKETILSEAILAFQKRETIPIPDTGSLRSDLIQWMEQIIAFYNSSVGLYYLQIVTNAIKDSNQRSALQRYWHDRFKLADMIFKRAKQRKEITLTINSIIILEILFGWIQLRLITTGIPPDRHSCEQLVDYIIRFVPRKATAK
jgi:AcrR family transcriptional regulator